MTIENLKQIAIKYATTKGSRVPLAPDELCNAVVQYFNEFLKITADINTIQVAVTEEGGNIVFTITGNTLDGKAFTPIVITVDHNDFVTNQEFEEFKTSVTKQLNNKRSVISSPASSYVVYTQANGLESNLPYSELANQTSTNIMARRANGTSDVKKGISGENVANMENIADLEEKIPSTDNFLLKNVVNIINYSKFKIIDEIGSNIIGKADASNNMAIGSGNYAMQLNSSMRPIICTPVATYELAYISDVPAYKNVYSVSYDSTNGAIITYDGSVEMHIPLLAGENVTINASEDNKKIIISAAGGGGTGDVTAAGNNTFTGENTFTNEITFNTMKSESGYIQFGNFNYETTEGYDYLYIDNTHINIQKFVGNNQYHEININADLMAYAPPDDNVHYEYRYPRKNGTFALTSDIPDTSSFVTLADLEEKIPSTDNFLLKNVVNIINYSKFKIIDEIGSNIIGKADASNNMAIGSGNYAMQLNSSMRPIICTPVATYELAYISDVPAYKNVYSVSYDSTNGAIITYDGSVEMHIPLLAGENVTINASEDNKKIIISAAGGGGTGDVTAAGNNTFTGENTFTNEITFNTMKSESGYIQFGNFNYETTEGYDYLYIDNTHINIQKFVGNNQYHEININADLMAYAPPDDNVHYEYRYPRKNGTFALTSDIPDTSSFVTLAGDNTFGGTNTFNNSIYAKNGVVAGDTTNYGANSVTKGSNTYSFPNKSGTFAMTTDIIKDPIYFISFYANAPSEPCHLIGTMMSKNSYGTGQKTNEEFAVMLADNLYTNSNEGLAVYGKLAEKDILCIYSEDGLSSWCLNEEDSQVELPSVMFFVMETEL